MGSSKSNCFRNTIFVVYVLAFVGLTGFGIWDVTNIIIDYIEDNQFSLVKVRNSTIDRYRFVPTFRACLIVPPLILISGSAAGFNSRLNSSWHQEDIVWPRNMSKKEAALASDMIDLRKMDLVTRMDNDGLNYVNDKADVLNIDRSKFKVMVSNFIKNADSIVSTKRALEIAKNLTSQGQPNTNDSLPASVNLFGLDNALFCLSLPVADGMTKNAKNDVRHLVNFIYKETASKINVTTGQFGYSLTNELMNVLTSTSTTAITMITIKTKGLIDSSRFPPCQIDFESEADCLHDLKRRVIADICQCTQFSYSWRNDFFGNKTENGSMRFCAPEIYEECWQKAIEEVERRQKVVAQTGACKPCFFAKNTYTVKTEQALSGKIIVISRLETSFRPWYPQSAVTLICRETTYLLIEERQQINFSQLVSQVGGDLGLYIGFSMISILQLIVYLYNMRRRRQESLSVKQKKRDESIHFYMKQILSSVLETDLKEERCATDERATRKDMIETKSEIRDEINQMEARIYEKLDAVLRESRHHW